MVDQTTTETDRLDRTIKQNLEVGSNQLTELGSGDAILAARDSRAGRRTNFYYIREDVLEAGEDEFEAGKGYQPFELAVADEPGGFRTFDEDRAEWLELVDDRLTFGVELDEGIEGRVARIRDMKIPTRVAIEGKPIMAAYLAAHGISRGSIAHSLDVSESTISQYLSDLKAGRR